MYAEVTEPAGEVGPSAPGAVPVKPEDSGEGAWFAEAVRMFRGDLTLRRFTHHGFIIASGVARDTREL